MRAGGRRRWHSGEATATEQAQAESFYESLLGEGSEARTTPPLWLPIARRLPVTYRRSQPAMQTPILGVVVHTTNHGRGAATLERFQRDWQALQSQTAHFMVDREGNIGQFRSTTQIAWHIKTPQPRWDSRYFGIEHISKLDEGLTYVQLERSARLIGDLAVYFGFPARRLPSKGGRGIGIHVDFNYTGCGRTAFWSGRLPNAARTATYDRLVRRAHDFATLGF